MVTSWNGEPYGAAPALPSDFLCTNPRGAYTAARTFGQPVRLAHWESHVSRLAQHVRLLAEADPDVYGPASSSLVKPGNNKLWDLLSVFVTTSAASAIRHLRTDPSHPAKPRGGDIMVTTLVCGCTTERAGDLAGAFPAPLTELLDVRTHAAMLHLPPLVDGRGRACMSSVTEVAVLGPGRQRPSIKDSQWARERGWLTAAKQPLQPAVSEVVLSRDGDGEHLLEGLVTNLFIVARDQEGRTQVQTASLDDGVLPGVVRAQVLEVCNRLGFLIVECAPSRSESGYWREAFLTGSGSMVKPVSAIHWLAASCSESGGGFPIQKTVRLPEACGPVTKTIYENLVMWMPESSLTLQEMGWTS
eukprot:jgi/Mesvir1/2881/Mv13958-RA.1